MTSPSPLQALIQQHIRDAGGWIGFDRFMSLALYAPGLGYYSNERQKFGLMPQSGSDFVTAPELSPLFGQALAAQLAQALEATGTRTVWEFGAGTGALAAQLLQSLGERIDRYCIVDLSASLAARQAERLQALGPLADKVEWVQALPPFFEGVVIGNEVLDAMPVQLLSFDGQRWMERGVALGGEQEAQFVYADRPTHLRPSLICDSDAAHFPPGTVTEIHSQAEAFVRTLAAQLKRGAIFLIDYGFPEGEYYHPQRAGGTLMCHHQHRADPDPLVLVGEKDITAHVNFTGIALVAQDAGLSVLGYTSQANFLINCGIVDLMAAASLPQRSMAHKLIAEHEMGELFKVIGLAVGPEFEALGFAQGDRSHML
ncbi:SAM-dependent MidA family methyltransferase [Paucibacter oligotrophus]|uniref:SAM-dependent MidA family methyltransferase n=1 Tax=Roseateles oligotrophus TaxID=1769250 RepID=A0A840LF03_9BURK|nr:SAM-dependent methyltransferase [Roseateles oligotrophus]MBB4845575.1 SAM-dependent MidA family methyltransferase [Roseateles oligotrophus]